MENPTTPEVQPIAEQSEAAQSKSPRPTAKQRKSELEDYRNNEICDEMKRKYGLTYGENKDNVKTQRLKGRPKTRQEIYLAVQAAKRLAKDWTTFQRELAQKGVTVRKKFRRGSTEVDGLSYFKDGQKFKASQVDRNGRCSYDVICNALDRNKKTAVPAGIALAETYASAA